MDKESNSLKRCSTSTDVEAADHKGTKLLQKAERELQNSMTDVNPKKRKKKSESKETDEDDLEPKKKHKTHKKTSEKKELKKLRKSFKEMTETMKNLQDFFLQNADLPGISLKEMLLTAPVARDTSSKEEEHAEKMAELTTYECVRFCLPTSEKKEKRIRETR